MVTNKERRRIRRINNRMKKKLALTFAIVVLAFIGLSIRIVYINKTNGEKYTKKVLTQQESNSKTLPYRRGDIYDRNGNLLATSEKVYSIILDPKVLNATAKLDTNEEDTVEETLSALSECFGMDKTKLYDTYQQNITSSYVVLDVEVTKEVIEPFEEMAKDNSEIAGVWFEESYLRKYPYDSVGCNLIGYTVSGNVGQYGIEESYTDVLNGTDGRSYTYLDENLEKETVIHDPQDGYSIMSTMDLTLQQIVEDCIDDFMAEYENAFREGDGAKTVAVVMMDPRNGEILAMASNRRYDLNNPFSLVSAGVCTEEEEKALIQAGKEFEDRKAAGTTEEGEENPYYQALNDQWRNFCVSDTYEPGSTVKPMTVAAALECGAISPGECYFCDGKQQIIAGQKPIKCAKRSGHGMITLEGSLMFSCNDALMQIASKMGYENFVKYQRMFNFGLKTGIDLPGESRTDTVVYYTEENAPYSNLVIGPTELATCSFGQGFNVSMIQVASAFSACINGGYYYQPHVVKKIMDSDGGTVEENQGTLLRTPISKETSELVKKYLYSTMYGEKDANGNGATGKSARIAGYAMGGKTGTAQKIPRGQGNYLVSFIGYAPYDTPEVVCYVVVDEPNSDYQASSSYAQGIWKNIMKQALPYLNIYETEEPPADMMAEYLAAHPEKDPDKVEAAPETKPEDTTEDDGVYVDPQTGENVTLPDVSDDPSVDPETGMLKDLTQDDDYPSDILEDVQPSAEGVP